MHAEFTQNLWLAMLLQTSTKHKAGTIRQLNVKGEQAIE
ncbi:hypothetical protein MAMP_02360 [Methylophaga aminisulfidivorans MP]|uniref:Uncharacterized protein n=1 Tax=Methylophaga aminisulfidivorans MP TaxID=1026882 RepID=F5SWB9_9GAMM|nr:hypothetical protein MAMP_02360 [Methylophaga aminisulfidivorans MP]